MLLRAMKQLQQQPNLCGKQKQQQRRLQSSDLDKVAW
jgi:hypothetical protein